MAERKTKYTNADLKPRGGPATEYGPWKVTKNNAPRTSLDALLDEGASVESILADSRKALSTPAAVESALYANSLRQSGAAANRAKETPMPTGIDALQALLEVPRFIPGPVGVGAGLAHAGLSAAEGNYGDAAMGAGFSLVPGAVGYGAKRLGRAAPVAREIKRAYPSSMQYGPVRPPSPTAASAAERTGTGAIGALIPESPMPLRARGPVAPPPSTPRATGTSWAPGAMPMPTQRGSNLTKLSSTEAVRAGQGPSGGARGVQMDPANLSRLSSTEAVLAGQGPSGGARGARVSIAPSIQVLDDVPVEQVPLGSGPLSREGDIPDVVADLMRQARNASVGRQPGNIVRQRGTVDIEAELRALGASEKDIRQLYHMAQSRSKGAQVSGEGVLPRTSAEINAALSALFGR